MKKDLSQEIESYIAHEIDDNIARGMSPQEARWQAHKKFGNTTAIQETIHEMNPYHWLESVAQDLRYGLRQLRLSPGFTLVAALSLALGIGANTAIFQLIDTVRLRALPVDKPQELVEVRIPRGTPRMGRIVGGRPNLTNPQWEFLRANQQAFSGIFAWGTSRMNLASGGEVRWAEGLWVSGEFFSTLGVNPVVGRTFIGPDDRRGCAEPGVVISHTFWQREFASDPSVLSRKVTLDGHPFPIIGVTPAGFFGVDVGRGFDVALPLCAEPILRGQNSSLDQRAHYWLAVIGRLKPGFTISQLSAHLAALAPPMFQATLPSSYLPDMAQKYLAYKLSAESAATGVSALGAQFGEPLLLLLGTAAMVLLIACANLANLLLARSTARQREYAVRLAIGASRFRLIRQLLAESLLLAAIGAVGGALLSQVLSRGLVAFLATSEQSPLLNLALDWRIAGFAAIAGTLTCILFGLGPAIKATHTDPGAAMKSGGRVVAAGGGRFGMRRMLAVGQVALGLVLLVSALLCVRSFRNLVTVDAGFRQNNLLVLNVTLNETSYPAARRNTVYDELLHRLRSTPGVESAAEVALVPLGGGVWNDGVRMEGGEAPYRISGFNRVSPGYLQTMGTQLLAGRDFDTRDRAGSPAVAIVTETFVRTFTPGANPIGRRIRVQPEAGKPEDVVEIIGVAKDSKYASLRADFEPLILLTTMQEPQLGVNLRFLIYSRSSFAALSNGLKQTIASIDPGINVEFRSFESRVADNVLRDRLMATLTSFFGGLAVVISVIGLYGVISYTVERRRNEIGIRVALGAARTTVARMILGEAAWLLGFGLAIGVALTIGVTRAANAVLFGLKPNDPVTIGAAVVVLGVVAMAASYLPARRAANMDPMAALRND